MLRSPECRTQSALLAALTAQQAVCHVADPPGPIDDGETWAALQRARPGRCCHTSLLTA